MSIPRSCRTLLASLLSLVSVSCATTDPLFESFREPSAESRPFVRWWWNGSRVNEKEILRELDVMKAAGIGGVEINTIGMPEALVETDLSRWPARPWLSPAWNEAVRTAAEGARARGMIPDLIVGSGWPFGARFLAPEEQIRRIRLQRRVIDGPAVLTWDVGGLERVMNEGAEGQGGRRRRREDGEAATSRRLAFLRLAKLDHKDFTPGVELADALAPDGSGRVDVPEGKHVLYAGWDEIGFSHVKLGAPGADGPVVDHLNAAAVRHYLDHMSKTLGPSLGGRLGNQLRAMFVDSLELDGANWTADLAAEFEKRRGYVLAPYLPFVLDRDDPADRSVFADSIRRVRYDYLKTIVELFHERFLATYVAWCRDNGVLSRIQAYGREAHPLEGSLEVDLPEAETWLQNDGDRIRVQVTTINRYVGSAARIAGKPIVSFEAMTNSVPVFRETLEDFKRGLDASLLTGVHHAIVHGFNYTPPEAGFPGWVRFGDYLNDQNPWWPHFRKWADYSARLSALFRRAVADGQVAILAPRADEWSRHGLLYQPFPELAEPWYQYELGDALAQQGSSSDFVSESIVARATVEGGRLRHASRSWEALLLEDVETLEPATAEALARHAQAGLKIVFIGRRPSRAPSLADAAARDLKVRAAIAKAFAAAPERVRVVPSPEKDALLPWTGKLLTEASITPTVRIATPSADLSQLRLTAGTRTLYFFTNTHRTRTVTTDVTLPEARPLAMWDPETGARAPFPAAGTFKLALGPVESLLLVSDDRAQPAEGVPTPRLVASQAGLVVAGPWTVDLQPMSNRPAFTRKLEALADLAKMADDPPMATFAGVATYRADVVVSDPSATLLDLGVVEGPSEVSLNGVPLGARWYGRHVYDARSALKPGANKLEVRVTVGPANYAKSLKDTDVMAKRWAFWFPPIPSGLVGPVRLSRP